jgi:cell migration-inducing and hyaluronan-binding protein
MRNYIRDLAIKSATLSCAVFLAAFLVSGGAWADTMCGGQDGNPLKPSDTWKALPTNGSGDLKVVGPCLVVPGFEYHYRNVNIINNGLLAFREHDTNYQLKEKTQTHFWASSIIIEKGGEMAAHSRLAGTINGQIQIDEMKVYGRLLPFGTHGGVMTIHLYGKNEAELSPDNKVFTKQNLGAVCKSEDTDNTVGPCGIPTTTWSSNGDGELRLPGNVRDFFYQYGPLYGDGRCDDGTVFANGKCGAGTNAKAKVGYFGNKVIGVSYGGSLNLAGAKGACHDIDIELGNFPCYGKRSGDSLRSEPSWTRLAADLMSTERFLRLDHPLRAQPGDEIVVTTTDYLPSHSELFTIDNIEGGVFVEIGTRANWAHNGTRYGGAASQKPLAKRLPEWIQRELDPELVKDGAETRAAVALLTRSIRIVSAGDDDKVDFLPEETGYSYGAHLVIRQGFEQVQIQGVEFKQMGQGGRLAHYPVHFHMARKTPKDTYVKESSINESMTRWIVIHSTHGVTLAGNVGYKSIGHGFYLEDGTEIDNKFHSNIGIFARAAVDYDWRQAGDVTQNPRKIPGILAANQAEPPAFPYRSDVEFPSVFWITNGWNDFVGNMAAGAGTCGAAYWLVPASNSDHVEVSSGAHAHMKWSGYASQQTPGRGGTTPLRTFDRNYATSTMLSLQTTADAPPCHGVIAANDPGNSAFRELRGVKSQAPPAKRTDDDKGWDNVGDPYYPHVFEARRPTICPAAPNGDCSTVATCAKEALGLCAATVINRYTSSFHWAHGNVSAVWLRPQWYLLSNSVISDVQNGGLTFVSGGDYTQVITGYWALAKNSLFIGNTIDNTKNAYTRSVGPFNVDPDTELRCDKKNPQDDISNYCLSAANSISMPVVGFMTNQRLQNIYDGPAFQDANAYLDINPFECAPWQGNQQTNCMYGASNGILRLKSFNTATKKDWCYLPNAAIGWKQPNGFYYPPSFHSRKLFFDNVDLRHYVINPLFTTPAGVPKGQGGTYITDDLAVRSQYCPTPSNAPYTTFDNWTSIDRQTVLNDDDGTLTGLSNVMPKDDLPPALQQTISVNDDAFFNAPVETAECASAVGDNGNATCKTPDTKQSPATAKTSPYDYISTVVHRTTIDGVWDHDCGGPFCYGVPLYRQYLTDSEMSQWSAKCGQVKQGDKVTPAECRWPFIRMAGADISQRQTMTVNNGLYYLDTNVSKDTQQSKDKYTNVTTARTFNVFQEKQTYKVFFVYPKQTTVQTYDIYVGKGLNFPAQNVSAIRVALKRINDKTNELDVRPATNATWLTVKPVDSEGIVRVTVNFNGVTELEPTRANGLCQPQSFCKADSKSCVSTLPIGHTLKADRDSICSMWAVKDLDCPEATYTGQNEDRKFTGGGCFGFTFTLPERFNADDSHRRPKPGGFPVTTSGPGKPDWTTKFKTIAADKAGQRCTYNEPPNRNCLP